MKLGLWLSSLLLIFYVVPSFAGGLSTSGGGSGVACFSSEKKAQFYQSLMAKGEDLPEVFYKDVKSLVTLETWERELNAGEEVIKPRKTWQLTLEHFHRNIYYISPLFLFRLKQFADIAQVSSWTSLKKIDLLEDATPRKPLTAKCLRVQIAKRYSEQKSEIGTGPVENFVTAKIEFNERLFAMLSVLDQAILVLHEQLYLVGGTIGHINSDLIRRFVNLFVIDYKIDPLVLGHFYSSKQVFSIRWKLVSAFGDYPVYFVKEKLPEEIMQKSKQAFSPQSRFYSFLEMLLRLREKVKECREYNKEHAESPIADCLENSVQGVWKENNLTNEQAFAFVTFFGIDRGLGMNSEYLFDPSLKVMSPKDAEASLFVFCNEIQFELKPLIPFYQQAIEYCSQAQAANQTTKKKDQN